MSSQTSFVTKQEAPDLYNQKRDITFFINERLRATGLQSQSDIRSDSFMAKTIKSVASLNGTRANISAGDYKSQINTIIADCCAEEANGDYRIQVTEDEVEFQKLIDDGNRFPVLWTDNPSSPTYTRGESNGLVRRQISFLPNKTDKTIDVWANWPIPEESGLVKTLERIANLNRLKDPNFLTHFSNALMIAKGDKSVKKWIFLREHESREHDARKAHPSWYPAILPDGSICLSRTQALRYNASKAVTTGSQTDVSIPKSVKTLIKQDTVPDDWELAAE